ncbi:GNAT family N-acetyltransferase [Glycomyces buryatensis]|uniref:GNAT family N-acetyltransferase n=1 Tax=Glycomyces buryatensis TaxID=2570927 RepID=A0A4S8QDA8_9ACTN|nr:GNAT family N-acetyltransferase [Glycomyces buryatensis]THV42523.1 GNAT family N-acetyltransferase [Glycomyces buryatensis]
MPASDLTVRPLVAASELDRFLELSYVLDDELADDLAAGRRRPEWMWIATRGTRVLARASWWSSPGAEGPGVLDFFDVDDTLPPEEGVEVGFELLSAAMKAIFPEGATPPEYGRFIPPSWREDAAARQVVETRFAVLERLGARQLVERLRLEWRAGTPLPETSKRLTFRPVSDREELVDLMVPVLEGTLDAHSGADLERMTPREAAEKQHDEEFAGFDSPREWWQVATLDSGEAVGFVIPARNIYNAIIAYIGVLPAHRGHGYVDDLLAEGTRILAERDVPRIRAATDLPNVPMAAAFQRAGYVNFERAVNFTWETA